MPWSLDGERTQWLSSIARAWTGAVLVVLPVVLISLLVEKPLVMGTVYLLAVVVIVSPVVLRRRMKRPRRGRQGHL